MTLKKKDSTKTFNASYYGEKGKEKGLKTNDEASAVVNDINGAKYNLEKNPMEIEYVKFDFDKNKGTLTYKNKQGEKNITFGIGYNEFGKFPEEGYSNEYGSLRTQDGFKYNCATSLAWTQVDKITVFSQIIDKYFGNVTFSFYFKNDLAFLRCVKTAEDFLWEYKGDTIAFASC